MMALSCDLWSEQSSTYACPIPDRSLTSVSAHRCAPATSTAYVRGFRFWNASRKKARARRPPIVPSYSDCFSSAATTRAKYTSLLCTVCRDLRAKSLIISRCAHLHSLGISLRSATEPIDDTATGKMMEGVLAAFAQFDNDVRSDRARVGMRSALDAGRWTFRAPLGYLNAARHEGKSLIHDPEPGPLIQRAFELFATGRYSQQQVLDDVTSRGLRGRHRGPLVKQMLHSILRNTMYIGLLNAPKFGVTGQPGDFDPLVSEKTFYRVQGQLTDSERKAVFYKLEHEGPVAGRRDRRCTAATVNIKMTEGVWDVVSLCCPSPLFLADQRPRQACA